MNNPIQLAKGIKIPLDAATQKLAFIGRSSSGKSYAASKFVEELLANQVQTVILDPVGIWYGLRLAADGKGKGCAIPVFGGEHGDIPLFPNSGALVASLVVEKGISCVLDVSYMRKNERKQFVTDFAETLFHLKKKHRSAIHLVIEEAQTFAPQRTISGEERMLGAMEDIVKIGRNYGIGVSLISQRPQSIHKDCLNQTEALFCFQINGTHERKAIVDWIVEKGLSKTDIEGDLSSLKVGTCFLWSPQWLKILQKVEILKKKTFDSGKTPETGAVLASRTLAPVDLEEIKQSMESVIQAKKENDPAELKKEIITLKRQLAQAEKGFHERGQTSEGSEEYGKMRKEIASLKAEINGYVQRFKSNNVLIGNLLKNVDAGNGVFLVMEENLRKLMDEISVKPMSVPKQFNPADSIAFPISSKSAEKKYPAQFPPSENGNGHLPIGEKKILIACAMYPSGLRSEQLTVLTGYKRSSRDAYIQRLSEKGLVQKERAGTVRITEQGAATLGDDYQPLPTGEALQQYWLGNLPTGEKKILELLLSAYPESVDKETLSEESGYKRSSRDAYLQRMMAKEIVVEPERGFAKASENLFS